MPYVPVHADWRDLPDTTTPITAAKMEYIEAGIVAAQAAAEAAIAKVLLDVKGDLIAASAADTPVRVPAGAADTVLTTDAAAPSGVNWQKIGNAHIASGAAISASKLAGYPSDVTQVLRGDGSWGTLAGIPSGVIAPFGGLVASIPTGWLHCDGSAISRATFAALFAVIADRYGIGDGSTTFNLPDFRGRTIFGLGSHADVNAHSDTDGVAEASRSPKHRHTVTDPQHSHTERQGGGASVGGPFQNWGGSSDSVVVNSAVTTLAAATGISVGPAGSPLDTPGYGVAVWMIKT